MKFLGADRAVGTWVKLPLVESVQILAHAGFQFIVVDQEHAPVTDRAAYELISMASALGVAPLVRVGQLHLPSIQRLLDAGSRGVLIPHIDTADDAAKAVRAVRFPPLGARGAGGTSLSGLWGLRPTVDYIRFGNEEALCVPQLESRIAMQNAGPIARTPGVDALFVGVADLSLDMGAAPVEETVRRVYLEALQACHHAGKPCGFASGSPEGAQKALDDGFDFVMVSSDTALFASEAVRVRNAMRRPN